MWSGQALLELFNTYLYTFYIQNGFIVAYSTIQTSQHPKLVTMKVKRGERGEKEGGNYLYLYPFAFALLY